MPIIYHVTTAAAWAEAQQAGAYESPSLKDEGFIHCSMENQVEGVLERYFAGVNDLVKLIIDTDKLDKPFFYDWSPSTADTFPHVYGAINTAAVIEVIRIR